jgi:hypothetical protein
MVRVRRPFDGMVYSFGMIDPENRLVEYLSVFHIAYAQDEQTLIVLNGGCRRTFGL